MDWIVDVLMLAKEMIAKHPVEVLLLVIAAGAIWKAVTNDDDDKKFKYMMSCAAIVCIGAAIFFYGGERFFAPGLSAEEAEHLTQQFSDMTENYKNSSEALEYFFYDGENLSEYYAHIEEFLRFKAGRGFTEAQFYLGYMLDPKHTRIKRSYPSIRQNQQEAKNFYAMAADKGYIMAQFCLGNAFFDEKDYINAAKYYKLAADKGYSGARKALGYMYGLGYIHDVIDVSVYGQEFQDGYNQGRSDR